MARLWPCCARGGGTEDARQLARPGCGGCASAGAGGELPGSKDAPAVAVLRWPGREGGDKVASTPLMWPFCVSQGGGMILGN